MKTKPCGNPKCGVSTGIRGSFTFGSGRLSDYGYWSKPCDVCRDAYYAREFKRFAYKSSLKPEWSVYSDNK